MDAYRIERIKAEMRDEAAKAIDDLGEGLAKQSNPTLLEMEEAVLMLRQRLAQRMMEVIVAEQEQVRPAPGPMCQTCGEEMMYKGKKEVRVESRLGPLRVERGYYYCHRCRTGVFPPR
jgi:uncharacterized protein with PIN domain